MKVIAASVFGPSWCICSEFSFLTASEIVKPVLPVSESLCGALRVAALSGAANAHGVELA